MIHPNVTSERIYSKIRHLKLESAIQMSFVEKYDTK